MEQNDQVQDGPFTEDSGEIEKDASKEENSAVSPSVKKAPKVPETTDTTDGAESGEKDPSAPAPTTGKKKQKSAKKAPESSSEEQADSTEEKAPAPLSEINTVPSEEKPAKPSKEKDRSPRKRAASALEQDVTPEEKTTGSSAREKTDASEEEVPGAPLTEKATEEKVGSPGKKTRKSRAGETKAEQPEPEAAEPAGETKAEQPELEAAEPAGETKAEKPKAAAAKPAGVKKKAESGHPKGESSMVAEFDYSTLTREDLVNRLEVLLENQNIQEIRSDIDHIKVNFYKKNKAEVEQKRKKFIEDGGDLEDFKPLPDALEEKIKRLLKQYREQKTEFNRNLEVEKQENLRKKYEVIEKIKELVNRKESINKTFNEFRDLQREWRMIGLVPQQNLKDLWDTYNHHVEKFYDYIKINRELRDLDLKKNLELKMQLCERAEELLMESSVVNAFKSLQKYHDRWREIGPVPIEIRTEIWERFKEATSKINKKHQEHFEELKKEQKKNLEQKTLLCEKAEEISEQVLKTHKQWDEKSRELIELQKVWKTIGFAPKKDNNKIYERFRKACDNFFNRKREFYAHSKELQLNNLQLKTDLCVQAEALQDSTEWKKTTDDLINLQKKWKEVGPVPKKHSDAVWKRFRAACDHFFKNKSDYYKNIEKTYSHNLEEKKKILKEVDSLKLTENVEENFKVLNQLQRRWSEIGFVPFKEKEVLQEEFRKAINRHFDNMEITDRRKNILKFRNKLNNMLQKPKSDLKINQERERYINRLQQLKNDIVLWENNIGFFTKSKSAESMIDEVQAKIDRAKESIILLEKKIEMIDNLDQETKHGIND